jgi:hypothetical protein
MCLTTDCEGKCIHISLTGSIRSRMMRWVRYVERIREMRYLYIIYFDNVEEKDSLADIGANNSDPWSYLFSHKYTVTCSDTRCTMLQVLLHSDLPRVRVSATSN